MIYSWWHWYSLFPFVDPDRYSLWLIQFIVGIGNLFLFICYWYWLLVFYLTYLFWPDLFILHWWDIPIDYTLLLNDIIPWLLFYLLLTIVIYSICYYFDTVLILLIVVLIYLITVTNWYHSIYHCLHWYLMTLLLLPFDVYSILVEWWYYIDVLTYDIVIILLWDDDYYCDDVCYSIYYNSDGEFIIIDTLLIPIRYLFIIIIIRLFSHCYSDTEYCCYYWLLFDCIDRTVDLTCGNWPLLLFDYLLMTLLLFFLLTDYLMMTYCDTLLASIVLLWRVIPFPAIILLPLLLFGILLILTDLFCWRWLLPVLHLLFNSSLWLILGDRLFVTTVFIYYWPHCLIVIPGDDITDRCWYVVIYSDGIVVVTILFHYLLCQYWIGRNLTPTHSQYNDRTTVFCDGTTRLLIYSIVVITLLIHCWWWYWLWTYDCVTNIWLTYLVGMTSDGIPHCLYWHCCPIGIYCCRATIDVTIHYSSVTVVLFWYLLEHYYSHWGPIITVIW